MFETLELANEFLEKLVASGGMHGYTSLDAKDVVEPVHVGRGTVVFPVGWTAEQCAEWRAKNDLTIPERTERERHARTRIH